MFGGDRDPWRPGLMAIFSMKLFSDAFPVVQRSNSKK